MTSNRSPQVAPTHDETWFRALFDAHATAVYRYLRRRLPSDGPRVPDAEDLTADVLAIAWRRRADVPDDAALPWLYRTAAYVLANHRRKSRPVPLGELPDVMDEDADVEASAVDDDAVRRVLGTLTARDRRILLLHGREGLRGDALADALGISRGGADAALSRARARLRDAWAAHAAGVPTRAQEAHP